MIVGTVAFSRMLRSLLACVVLATYALVPAAAVVHEKLEHRSDCAATVSHTHDPDHHSEKHHDESHCQVCQVIHGTCKQIIVPQIELVTELEPRAPVSFILLCQSDSTFIATSESPRAPPAA